MKYWVYKESRVLGPFDKEAVSGFPGIDAGTLVCAGDPAGGSWVPAGELEGLAPRSFAPPLDDPSSGSLLDDLQIDAAGLINDDDFPSSFSEELFQDAGFKKDFSDLLSDRIAPDEASARKARETISALTAQLEAMYRRVSELEAGQTDMARKLAAKDAAARAPAPAAAAAAPDAPAAGKTFLSPAPPPIQGGAPPVAAVPTPLEPVGEWPAAPPAGAGGFPSFGGGALPPSPAAPELPSIPALASSDAPPAPLELEPTAPIAPKPLAFAKAKTFKAVPTVKSFKIVGPEHAPAPASQNPVPEFKFEPIVEEPAAVPPPPPPPPAAAAFEPPPAAVLPPVPVFAPPPVQLSPAPAPAPFPAPQAAPITNPFSLPARPDLAPLSAVVPPPMPTPVPPPNTLSRSQPVPDLTGGSEGTEQLPPMTMARSAGSAAVDEPAADGAAARFAKPEPAPPTGEIKKPGRNNKVFLIGAGALVVLLMILGVIFMRQPKDDLKQMTTLDDGKAPLGVAPDDAASAPPPIVKPKLAPEPPPQAAPAPPPGPSAEHAAAMEAVKDFPLDGGRGTVGRWLEYSYTASPGAGTEEWNASTTGDNTVLVEYRLVPGSSGGRGALYLFEVDGNGIVMGKNIEARQMLAGGPPPQAPKAKKKPAKKAPSRRREAVESPKEVPQLPLPDSGELRPPAEDDGSFGSDTVNSGI